jgi:hypothetical protein
MQARPHQRVLARVQMITEADVEKLAAAARMLPNTSVLAVNPTRHFSRSAAPLGNV